MVFSKSLLTMLVWLQAHFWLTSSAMTSEPDCEVDGAAYLQHKGGKSNSCDLAQFNGGNCNDDGCNCFPPAAGGVVGPFGDANGILTCSAQNSCRRQSDPNPSAAWTFDGAQPMECSGQNSCRQNWVVDNVGGACLDGDNAARDMTVGMAGAAVAPSDVCCAQTPIGSGAGNNPTCKQSTFTNVEDMVCLGNNVCDQAYAEIYGDFYCQAKQGCGHSNNMEKFVFKGGGAHCVTCNASKGSGIDNGACSQANFEFEAGARVEMLCDGFDACQDAVVTVGAGGCLSLTCNAGPTGGGGGNLQDGCDGLEVDLSGGAALCICGGTAAGNCPQDCITDGSFQCEGLPTSCPGSFCCTTDVFAAAWLDDPFDCAGCTTSTTTSSSSSSSSSKSSALAPSSTSTAGGGGDPHIDTFDKQHYLLLQQGTFSLWRFSGLDAEILSAKKLHKKLAVDFKMYAHYSGRTSYTKGLMLVDNSGGAASRVLELTSQDCKWRTKAGSSAAWSTVEQPQLLSMPDAAGDEMTAFRMRRSPNQSNQQMMTVELLMKKDGSFKEVANVFVTCKPGTHINTKVAMASKEDIALVQGQLGSHGHTPAGEVHLPTASLYQSEEMGMHQRMRSDQEFETSESWTDLGGSEMASVYLSGMDSEGGSNFYQFQCQPDEKKMAVELCRKYLGGAQKGDTDLLSFESHFESCVFDVCNGGGETAAQLAVEIIDAE